jgi:hypothetical protein
MHKMKGVVGKGNFKKKGIVDHRISPDLQYGALTEDA